jgi:hypothetical protein
MENFERGEVVAQFEYRGRKVSIQANAKGYALAWLRAHPWTARMRCGRAKHEAKALRQGQIAVYSILRDWIKGQVTAVETGMLSFEGAFLGQILLNNGDTVLDRIEQTKLLSAKGQARLANGITKGQDGGAAIAPRAKPNAPRAIAGPGS